MVRALGHPTLTEIARESQLDKGQLSRCIRSMVASGLIMANESESDHRKTRLRLTPGGERLYMRVWPAMRARQETWMGAMNQSERQVVFSVLDRLDRIAETEDES